MGVLFYRFGHVLCRFIRIQCVRQVVLAPEQVDRKGGFLLACTHLSHLEPMIVGCHIWRPVRWMARIEFFRPRWGAALLHWGGAFPVDRFGQSAPAVRRAVSLVNAGELVGMFPEGGVAQGARSAVRGGAIKEGVCTIAVETRSPVIPVVVLGTEKLNRVGPWLPFRRGKVWIAFGDEVKPRERSASRRADRKEMAQRLRNEFVRTYQRLLNETGLKDDDVP